MFRLRFRQLDLVIVPMVFWAYALVAGATAGSPALPQGRWCYRRYALSLVHLGHYCLIYSITSTDPTDPYRKHQVPVSVLPHLYH